MRTGFTHSLRRAQTIRRNKLYRTNGLNLFSETALVVLISIVTLFLQLISFATTWSGSKVYLEGVFPFAPLLFALAIQATAYFLSNSLRTRITFLKVVAMVVALCCSTYYSYIGIYNSANSPAGFLQERYMQISDELTRIHSATLEKNISDVRLDLGDAYAKVNAKHSALLSTEANINAALEELVDVGNNYSKKLKAPNLSSYETYEEYAAAYQAYIAAVSSGAKAEKETRRADILSSYGFAGMNELKDAQQTNTAELSALYAALGISYDMDVDFNGVLSALYTDISTAIDGVTLGQPINDITLHNLTCLLQAAMLYSDKTYDLSALTNALNLCSESATMTVIADYQTLVSALPEQMVTTGNLMTLKSNMDSQIITAIITLNSVLPETERLNASNAKYQILDLYLIPIRALANDDTKTTAFFCLTVAALIDALSVLFAISIRKRRPVWKRNFLLRNNPEDYMPQICAALPIWNNPDTTPAHSLADFLSRFYPSPETEADGFMMQANISDLDSFYPFIALLSQINLAKVVPAGFLGNEEEMVLLRAKFVFWANALIYEENIRNICEEVTA